MNFQTAIASALLGSLRWQSKANEPAGPAPRVLRGILKPVTPAPLHKRERKAAGIHGAKASKRFYRQRNANLRRPPSNA